VRRVVSLRDINQFRQVIDFVWINLDLGRCLAMLMGTRQPGLIFPELSWVPRLVR
jgi:hypothetical protein